MLATALLTMLMSAPPASAHVELSSSNPADGAKLTTAPAEVRLEFSKDVSETLDEVTVEDATGRDVGGKPETSGSIVTVTLPVTDQGAYTVTWRSLGPDGHPITGSFRFTVGNAKPAASAAESGAHGGHAASATYPREVLERINTAARVFYYVALLLVVGGAMFATVIARGWRPRYFRRAAWLLLASSVTIFTINLALAGEHTFWGVINPFNFIPHLVTPIGRVAALSATLVLYCLSAYPRLKGAVRTGDRRPAKRLAIAAILLACAPSLGGHAVASDYWLLRVPLDMVHLIAAAIWFGGIVQLHGVSKPYLASHPAVYPAVVRYSRIAFGAVVALVVTGLFAAWAEIGLSLSDTFGTAYGRLVLVKAALLAATMPLAYANRERNVPAMVAQTTSASANLRRYVLLEIVILLLVLIATAFLVYETPPREMATMGDHSGMS